MRLPYILSIVAILCAGNPSRADKPATPATRTEIIANGKFLFVMLCPLALETEQGKAIRAKYPESGLYKNDGSKEPFWTVDWYREKVTVAWDGVHMIRFGQWPGRKGGLKDRTIPKESLQKEAVSFFAYGKLLREFPIADLIDDPTKLPTSVSHFRWLKSSEFFDDNLQFESVTFDGNLIRFDMKTAKILKKQMVD